MYTPVAQAKKYVAAKLLTPPKILLEYTEIQSQQGSREFDCLEALTLVPLELLPPGEWAEVEDVVGEPSWVSRMAELGLRVGGRLQMVRQGSPCLLQVGGCRLCVRGECMMQIFVRPVLAAG
jgi:ferrous iron transport protein A